jgi:(2R)-ethylmalonyl-CoA mutase
MPATLALARAGGTTGEWGAVMREVFGEYRAPTGIGGAAPSPTRGLLDVAARVRALRGGPVRLLVAKPGLDGHSNGAEQIAVAARDAGMEVIYSGIRMTVGQIAASARDEDPDVVGVSILSGSHMELVPEVQKGLAEEGMGDVPIIVGGIIPDADAKALEKHGIAAVFTPKDFGLTDIMGRIVDEIRKANDLD